MDPAAMVSVRRDPVAATLLIACVPKFSVCTAWLDFALRSCIGLAGLLAACAVLDGGSAVLTAVILDGFSMYEYPPTGSKIVMIVCGAAPAFPGRFMVCSILTRPTPSR